MSDLNCITVANTAITLSDKGKILLTVGFILRHHLKPVFVRSTV